MKKIILLTAAFVTIAVLPMKSQDFVFAPSVGLCADQAGSNRWYNPVGGVDTYVLLANNMLAIGPSWTGGQRYNVWSHANNDIMNDSFVITNINAPSLELKAGLAVPADGKWSTFAGPVIVVGYGPAFVQGMRVGRCQTFSCAAQLNIGGDVGKHLWLGGFAKVEYDFLFTPGFIDGPTYGASVKVGFTFRIHDAFSSSKGYSF